MLWSSSEESWTLMLQPCSGRFALLCLIKVWLLWNPIRCNKALHTNCVLLIDQVQPTSIDDAKLTGPQDLIWEDLVVLTDVILLLLHRLVQDVMISVLVRCTWTCPQCPQKCSSTTLVFVFYYINLEETKKLCKEFFTRLEKSNKKL